MCPFCYGSCNFYLTSIVVIYYVLRLVISGIALSVVMLGLVYGEKCSWLGRLDLLLPRDV